jgi:hypothetical protein
MLISTFELLVVLFVVFLSLIISFTFILLILSKGLQQRLAARLLAATGLEKLFRRSGRNGPGLVLFLCAITILVWAFPQLYLHYNAVIPTDRGVTLLYCFPRPPRELDAKGIQMFKIVQNRRRRGYVVIRYRDAEQKSINFIATPERISELRRIKRILLPNTNDETPGGF